jgi:beta-galactosidase/beta-glucuronidase
MPLRWTQHLSIITLITAAAARCLAEADAPVPAGVKAVWELDRAYREKTPTRERVCLNGLWRWQPVQDAGDTVPNGGWGYFKVPGSWPGIGDYMQKDCQTVYAHPTWKNAKLGGVAFAWYQREINIPKEWTERRQALYAEYLNSFATVFIDGKRVGELRFPGGELDVTKACRPGEKQVLSLFVAAVPLKSVMASYNDTNAVREVKGSVARRGFCGDVYLVSTPAEARIGDVRIDTSVRKGEIAFDVGLLAPDAAAQYALRAELSDGDRSVGVFTSKPFKGDELKEVRIAFTEKWRAEKLWDVHTPQNTYSASISLLDGGGKVVDTALPVRFGFREFWIEGRDFYLNGTRIFLNSVPFDNAHVGAAWCTYAAAKESMLRLMSYGINCVYTHNYGCEPGSHLGFEEILRAADDVGMLFSLSQPHFGHYEWQAPDADRTNGYARHAEFYVRVAQNHPAIVFYSMSHNATGYSEDMNPDMTDGIQDPRDQWAQNNAKLALRAEAIVKRLDPTRIVYHHSSGNLSAMHTSNFYPNWTPIQELSDWFGHWATEGVKPVFTCEYGAPFTWDWAMYRGWWAGKRTFGSAVVPWEFCLAEWNAQFLGDGAFQISEMEKKNLRFESQQLKAGKEWHRWDYPHQLGSSDFDERYPVFAMYYADNWRAFRTWGVSATSPWENGVLFKLRNGVDRNARKDCPTDWDNLQRPGFSPDYLSARYERMDLTYERSDWVATLSAQALIRNSQPLLAYIGGRAARFTSKDHNFLPGETVEKQLIIINNSRETVACECEWSLGLPQALTGSKQVSVKTGEQLRIPLRFELPAGAVPGKSELTATVRFSKGEPQKDVFTIHVMAPPEPVQPAAKIALFDPKGETAKLLGAIGVQCQPVEAHTDLAPYEILVVGKAALTTTGAAPDISRVRDGLKVIMFEQTSEALERRLGFRVNEYGLRQVFKRTPDHPVLAGIDVANLRDWRGAATLLSPKLKYDMRPAYGPTVKWCDIPVSRVWRCGCVGNVASVLIEKPARGDFLPILDGGFSLQYSPLMEYREGKGLVLFCQMDVTGRSEGDPAAERLARQIFGYVSAWKPALRRQALYVGDPGGKNHLESAGHAPTSYEGGKLSPEQVLVVGPGGGPKLAENAAAIGEWLKAGGNLLAIGLDEPTANAFLPFKVTVNKAEHIAAFFEPFGINTLLAGIGPADVHNRDPRELSLISGGATVIGDGVLAKAENANVVFCGLVPWQFEYKLPQNIKRTFRRASCLVSRLLANMGASGATPLLTRFASPVVDLGPTDDIVDPLWLEISDKEVVLPLRWKGQALLDKAPPPDGWQEAGFDDVKWRDIRVPGTWEAQFKDLADFDGVFLYRVHFQLPPELAGVEAKAVLGAIDDEDWTSINGKEIGSITSATNPNDYWKAMRAYPIPKGVLRAGENIITIKVNDLRQAGGILGFSAPTPKQMKRIPKSSRRWLEGLYLDEPEEWDDPYRFFRW